VAQIRDYETRTKTVVVVVVVVFDDPQKTYRYS
jgi:hypothetical protein